MADPKKLLTCVVFVMASTLVQSRALAQPGPDFGLDFVTVGAAGNRAATAAERNNAFDEGLNYGSVGHEFRITRTETTADQWIEFVRAYAPFNTGDPGSFQFTGSNVSYLGNGQYIGGGQVPNNPSWQMAARYVNWLNNNKVNEAWAFETGAYDTSTFTVNPDGTRNDQIVHTPGARFWIPSFEETFKAFYYDPNRYGLGQDGYWMYPNGSNVAPVSGPPGEGTTNTGTVATHGPGQWYHNVGSYPDVRTPWGLLDASGGAEEMTETTDPVGAGESSFRRRFRVGTSFSMDDVEIPFRDRTDAYFFQVEANEGRGFRVASTVPAPSSVLIVAGLACVTGRRRSEK